VKVAAASSMEEGGRLVGDFGTWLDVSNGEGMCRLRNQQNWEENHWGGIYHSVNFALLLGIERKSLFVFNIGLMSTSIQK